MKIFFDNIIFSLQNSGGISRIWSELIQIISKSNCFDIIYLEHKNNNCFRKSINLPSNLIKNSSNLFLRAIRYLPVQLPYRNSFIFHSSYYRYCNNPNAINITTVHDFTYEYFVKGIKKNIHCWQKHKAIKKSKYIICVSENTKRDLLNFMPEIDPNKIKVIYNGVSNDYYPLSLCTLENYNTYFPRKSFLLYVGSRAKYKNFNLVIECMKETRYNLIVVGNKFTKQEKSCLSQLLKEGRCYHAGIVSNQVLNILYNNAVALVYPSSYEGFGIPIIEAQKAGCPVISLNSSSIPEIIGKSPLLMEKPNKKELISKIKLLSDEKLITQIVEDGIKNASRFSWEKMCSETIGLYNQIIKDFS